jgi:DNA-binding MurR/RpiR family transcriptional regulator
MNEGNPALGKSLKGGALLEQIHLKFSALSAGHRAVGEFLLTHLDEAVFLTAAELAARSKTSESTVIRFAQMLGYDGYPDLQRDLQAVLRQKIPPTERIRRAGGIPARSQEMINRATEQASANLEETGKLLTYEGINAGARAIVQAKRKFVVGLRGSAGAAHILGHQLRLIQPDVFVQTQSGPDLFEALLSLAENDCVIAISYPRYVKATVTVLQQARAKRAFTITVTDSPLAPAAQISDVALVGTANSISFANSYVGAALAIDAIIAAVLSIDSEASLARLELLERAIEDQDFFYQIASEIPSSTRRGKKR